MSQHPAPPAPLLLNEVMQKLGFKADREPIFLTFFRSDCPWCAIELPRLATAFGRHEDLKVHVIGVAVGHDADVAAHDFAEEKGWNFPVMTDTDGAIRAAFGVHRVPSVVLVNATGYIERVYEGATEQLVGILEQTIFAAAHGTEPPEYDMVGNGCAP